MVQAHAAEADGRDGKVLIAKLASPHFSISLVGWPRLRRRPGRIDYLRYCSSLTFSNQSTFLPLRNSVTAICVIAVVGAAPCQCFSPGGNQMTSPGRISS